MPHLSDSTTEPGTGVYWESYWDVVVEKGDTGSQGAQGIQGNEGPQGIQGTQGAAGQGFTWVGYWVEGETYYAYDVAGHNGTSYVCLIDHASGSTTEPGSGTYSESYWEVFILGGSGGTSTSSEIRTFNAAILLDFSADPASGIIPNIGEADDDGFYVSSGSFTRVASGDTYYYQAAEDGSSLQYRAPHYTGLSGASFTSINVTDGAASVVLTDTARDLEVLYESLIFAGVGHRRAYKIQLKCDTNQFVTGFIGGIAKSGDEYTMDIYSYPWIATRNWNKYNVSAWDTASTTWEIIPECFTHSSTFLNRWGMSFWYKGATSPDNAITPILGTYDIIGANAIFKGQYVGSPSTRTDFLVGVGTAGSDFSSNGAILVPGQWTHYFISHGLYGNQIYVLINGRLYATPAGALGYSTPPTYGLLTLGGLSVQLGTQAPKSGTCYAFVRYWTNAPSEEICYPMFEYERNLLGFGRNVMEY